MEISKELKKQIVYQYYGQTYYYKNDYGTFKGSVGDFHTNDHIEKSSFKLILSDVSRMIEIDIIEISKISEFDYNRELKDFELCGALSIGLSSMTKVSQYLTSRGYDLPQHLLNGKTLFESGVAIYKK